MSSETHPSCVKVPATIPGFESVGVGELAQFSMLQCRDCGAQSPMFLNVDGDKERLEEFYAWQSSHSEFTKREHNNFYKFTISRENSRLIW